MTFFFATDPDVDRIAVVVMEQGKPFIFTGNQMACLAAEYLCRTLKDLHQVPPKPTFVKTIVTTELFRKIVQRYQASCLDVLTGFKYIGQKIAEWEEEEKAHLPSHHFIFGGEESFGYLYGTHAKDKDAVVSACLFSEMALHLKREYNKTLVDFLFEIYHQYGIHREKLVSVTLEGKEGAEKIAAMMKKLRSHPPRLIGNIPVVKIEDYELRTVLYLESGMKEPLTLPHSDVFRIILDDETVLAIRPSGTEPKLKIYCNSFEKHTGHTRHEMEKMIHKCDLHCDETIQNIKKLISG